MFNKIKDFVLTGKEKAVIGFLAGAVGSYLAQNGLTVKDIWSRSGFYSLLVGVATHILVYFTTNRTASQ